MSLWTPVFTAPHPDECPSEYRPCIYSVSETGKLLRAAQPRLVSTISAEVRRRLTVEGLLTEIDDQQVHDFILGHPRPPLETAFEEKLWQAGFKNAFCKVEGEAVEITFDFETRLAPPLHHIAVFIRSITRELRPGESCGTIWSTRRRNRLVVKFKFEPRRSGLEQFFRYRERQDSGEKGDAGILPDS